MKNILFSNGLASAGSIFWSAVLQVISVPILLQSWGGDGYGIWLMLSAIPTYVALSDLGLSSAATSDMTMAYARRAIVDVNRTFHSILWLTFLIFVSIVAILLLVFTFNYICDFSDLVSTYGVTIIILAAYSGVAMISRVFLSLFRSIQKYALGTIIYDALQFIEGAAVLFLAVSGYGFTIAAVGLLSGRVILAVVMYFLLLTNNAWLQFGFSKADKCELKRLLIPALGAFSIPAALAINIQGMVLVAGTFISPTAAAILNSTRTISRIAIQLVGIINRASVPEFSSAYARNDLLTMKSLVRLNVRGVIVFLFPGAILFAVFGSWAVEVWSNGAISPTPIFVGLISLSMFLHGCWYFSSNLLLAVNKHQRLAFTLLSGAVISVFVGIVLGVFYSLNGIAVAIIIAESIALFRVFFLIREFLLQHRSNEDTNRGVE